MPQLLQIISPDSGSVTTTADFTPFLLHIEHLRGEDIAAASSISKFGRRTIYQL
jgi:hypothetical protein